MASYRTEPHSLQTRQHGFIQCSVNVLRLSAGQRSVRHVRHNGVTGVDAGADGRASAVRPGTDENDEGDVPIAVPEHRRQARRIG